MNRRTKERMDLHLLCRIGGGRLLSRPAATRPGVGLTENLSRNGLLMRWIDSVALPEVGSALTVDIDLPTEAQYGPRVMRCQATVVRIVRTSGSHPAVGMKIGNIRVITAQENGRLPLEFMEPADPRPV